MPQPTEQNQDIERVHRLATEFEKRCKDVERANDEAEPIRAVYYESHKCLFLGAAMAILVDENNAPEVLTVLAHDLQMGYSPEMAAQTMADTLRQELLERMRRTAPGRES